jgi:predicted nuclease with TOPRIM domain
VNQFRNHIKKIENEYTGEEINELENHYNYINQYENEFEEQRENCINCYSALKEQISLIEKTIPNFDINIFNTFFQTFEEYYSFFTKSQDVLKKFSEYNDDTQNLFYICKRKNFCIDALKEFIDKISVEYADKIEQYEILNEKYKYLTESYDKLYNAYQETKSMDIKKYENINNKELMIKNLNETIQTLNIENDRIKKKYLDCSRDLEGLNMAIKVNYVLKSESDKYINELQFKMKKYEIDNKAYKENLKNLKEENEKLIQEKEY